MQLSSLGGKAWRSQRNERQQQHHLGQQHKLLYWQVDRSALGQTLRWKTPPLSSAQQQFLRALSGRRGYSACRAPSIAAE